MTCRVIGAIIVLIALALLGGCVTYGDWVGHMEGEIAHDDPQGALKVLESRSGMRGKDAALYQMNRGILLRMDGDFAGSNAAFETAKIAIDQQLAISVTEQAGALTINEAQRAYVGEPFERAYIHVYEALNYLDMGKDDQARVEILQLDVLLSGFEKENQYNGSAFPRYLSGMIFESLGEWSDAMIAYRKAYEAYRRYPARFGVGVSRYLARDLVRLGERLGLKEEAEGYRKEFNLSDGELVPTSAQGEVIFLLQSGLAPVKQESGIVAPTTQGRLVSVSLPYYVSRRPAVSGAVVTADGATARATLVEDIDSIAAETLEQERPALLARAIARAVIKNDISRRVSKDNELLGVVTNIAGVVTERADTRSWSTLPNRIYLARLPLPPGRHVLHVQFNGGADAPQDYPIDIAAGEKRFISVHKVTPQDLPTLATNRRRMQ